MAEAEAAAAAAAAAKRISYVVSNPIVKLASVWIFGNADVKIDCMRSGRGKRGGGRGIQRRTMNSCFIRFIPESFPRAGMEMRGRRSIRAGKSRRRGRRICHCAAVIIREHVVDVMRWRGRRRGGTR